VIAGYILAHKLDRITVRARNYHALRAPVTRNDLLNNMATLGAVVADDEAAWRAWLRQRGADALPRS
jgi:hypothetical protein